MGLNTAGISVAAAPLNDVFPVAAAARSWVGECAADKKDSDSEDDGELHPGLVDDDLKLGKE